MKKTMIMLILSLVVLASLGTDVEAQVAKEGSTSFNMVYSSTFKVLPMGQERLQMTYEIMGAVLGDTSEDFHHNASFRCLGGFHVVKGEYKDDSGFCVFTRPDGDQVFATYKAVGKMGASGAKGTFTIVGGTGKLVGIQGSGELSRFVMKPQAEGTFQGYARWKGNYKIP